MPALTAGEKTLLRANGHRARFYLSINQPGSLLGAQVNGTLSRGEVDIPYDNGIGSGFAGIGDGQVARITTQTGIEYGRVRAITGSQSSGTVTIAANSIVTTDNDAFEILEDYPVAPRPPRFTSSTFYKDWTTTYTNQNSQPPPVIIVGPDRAGFLSSGSIVFDVDLTGSYAIAQGATMTAGSYAVTVTPSSGVTVNVTNGVGDITFTNAGQYWVRFSGADSNSKTQITWRRFYVHDPDPTDADYPYSDFEIGALAGGWDQNGWSLSITVNGVASKTVFPENTSVLLWYVPTYGATQQWIGGHAGAEMVLFSGYIRSGSIVADWEAGRVSFEAQTVDAVLRNLNMRSIPLFATKSPARWPDYASWLTNGRGLHHYYRYHSTLLERHDFFGLTDNVYGRAAMEFQKGDMLSQPLAIVRDNGIQANIVSNKAGQLHLVQDMQLRDDATRAAATVVSDITKPDRIGQITVLERSRLQAASVYVEGIAWDGNNAQAYCAKSPGDVPEPDGPQMIDVTNQTVASQAQTSALAGRIDARENNHDPEVRVQFDGIWAGALDVALQEFFTLSLASGDTSRGIVWTDKNLLPRQVNLDPDPAAGYIGASVVFEPEADGPAGISDPCIGLPDPPAPPAPQWSGAGLPALLAFASASTRDDTASDWTELQADAYTHGCVDPWSRIKAGSSNPRDAIWWASATGAIYRAQGISGVPENVTTPNDPPDTWSDTPDPAIADCEIIQIMGDRWIRDRFYALLRWQDGGGNTGGWLLVTDDNGGTWDYVDLYDGITLPDQIYPLWMAVNGAFVLVTLWADAVTDELRVVAFDKDLIYDSEVSLGEASLAEVLADTYTAIPAAVTDDDSLWYAAGRMVDPGGLSGTYHIIESVDSGSNWTSIESSWSADRCAALAVDDSDGFYGVRQGAGGSLGGSLDISVALAATVIISGTNVLVIQLGNFENSDNVLLWYLDDDESENVPIVDISLAGSPSLSSVGEGIIRGSGDSIQADSINGDDLLTFTFKLSGDYYISGIDRTGTPAQEGNDATNEDLLAIDNASAVVGTAGTVVLGTTRALVVGVNDTGVGSPRYRHTALLYQISTSPSISYTLLDTDEYETSVSAPAWDDQNHYLISLTSAKAILAHTEGSGTTIRAITTNSDVITVGSPLTISSEQLMATGILGGNGAPLRRLDDDNFVAATDTAIHIIGVSGTTLSDDVQESLSAITGTLIDFSLQIVSGIAVGVLLSADTVSAGEVDLYATAFHANTTTIEIGSEAQIVDGLASEELALVTGIGNNVFGVFWHRSTGGFDDIYVMKIAVDSGTSAAFYQGAGSLSERFALPATIANPGALALRGDGVVAIGCESAGSGGEIVVRASSADSYAAATDITGTLADAPITGLAWINGDES